MERLRQQYQERAHAFNEALGELEPYLTHDGLATSGTETFIRGLRGLCKSIVGGNLSLIPSMSLVFQDDLKKYFLYDEPVSVPAGTASLYRYHIDSAQKASADLYEAFNQLSEEENCPPPASAYAKPSTGRLWQNKDNEILNLRPSKNQSLPLSILSPLFAKFLAIMQAPAVLINKYTAIAHRAAHQLWIAMANSFINEYQRREEFRGCLMDLFEFRTDFIIDSTHPLELHSSRAGLYQEINGHPVLIGVIKHEFDPGDPYMQVSRGYQALVHKYQESKEVKDGLPCILLSLIGPVLIVSSGFCDGQNVILEPLTEPCLMMPDFSRQRQTYLARLLMAIRTVLDSFSNSKSSAQQPLVPFTPRIYHTFTGFSGKSYDFTFLNRIVVGSHHPPLNLLFVASSSEFPTIRLLAKLVFSDSYGVEVHRTLAKAGYAPELLGLSKVDGAPTAFIMEYLAPQEGWTTLHEYAKTHRQIITNLPRGLVDLLEFMNMENIVHGDLRPCNIMVREIEKGTGKELDIKVIDFDWAGQYGTARYPWMRNEDIPWPNGPGDSIGRDDDTRLLTSSLAATK